MATLDNIVNVQIALQTAAATRGDFGTPMIVAPLMAFTDRVQVYNNYSEAADVDLPPSLMTALSDCFSQIPRPRLVKVGRRAVASAIVEVASVTNLGTYTVTVGTESYSYTADATATATEIVAGLAALIDGIDSYVTADVSGDTLSIAYIDQSDIVPVVLSTNNLSWGTITAADDVADDLDAILDEDNGWYGLVLTERIKQTQLDAAEWTEANDRLFITASNEAGILVAATDDDIISTLQDTQYYRTAIMYHANADTEYPDAAWAGRVFTIQPGAETWALKGLASITPSKLTATQRQTIIAKGGNTFEYYQNDNNLALTNPGKTAAGEWIDVIRFRDWLRDTIQTNLVTMMINRDKVPYTDPGIALIVSNLRKSLQEGVTVGGIAPEELDANGETIPSFTITYPRSADIAPNIKATRILSISFRARIAGAIHMVEIDGALTYEL